MATPNRLLMAMQAAKLAIFLEKSLLIGNKFAQKSGFVQSGWHIDSIWR